MAGSGSRYACGLDLGTSRIKAALIGEDGRIAATAGRPSPPGRDGGVEIDPDEHFRVACEVLAELVGGAGPSHIAALAVTNQRATVVALDGAGETLGGISWQHAAGGPLAQDFAARLGDRRFRNVTGLPASSLWSVGKILWARKHRPDSIGRAAKWALLHDYVLGRLGAGELLTDPSNASVTGLLDVKDLAWSRPLLEAAGIREDQLPRIVPAASRAGGLGGEAARATGLPQGTPLVVGGGDQQCATLGMGLVDPGQVGLCLGTAAVVSCPSANAVTESDSGFFCTAHVVPGRWVLEGIHNAFGSSLAWVGSALGVSGREELLDLADQAPPGSGGALFLPFLAGIGSPDFDAACRGGWAGLDLSHGRSHLARAAVEGVCFEVRRIIEAMSSQVASARLVVAGGGSREGLMTRTLAASCGRELHIHTTSEASLLGTAMLAWVGAGRYPDVVTAVRACTSAESAAVAGFGADALEGAYGAYRRHVEAARRAVAAGGCP